MKVKAIKDQNQNNPQMNTEVNPNLDTGWDLPNTNPDPIDPIDPIDPVSIQVPDSTTLHDYLKSYTYSSYDTPVGFKGSRDVSYDPNEDEEEEGEDDERPRRRFDYTPTSLRIRPGSTEDFMNYINTRSLPSLLKYLIKSGILHETSNAMGFDPTHMNLEELRAHQGRQISSTSKTYTTISLKNIPEGVTNFDTKACNLDIVTLLEEIYLLPHYKKVLFTIDSRDILNQIMRESALRGISIEPKLRDNKFDFDSLRLNSSLIKLGYFGNINELFLVHDSYSAMYSNIAIYDSFLQIPVIKREVEEFTLNETVSINGKNYSKKMIESMIECNFDIFLENLEIEKYISSLEPVEKESLINIQDIKLI